MRVAAHGARGTTTQSLSDIHTRWTKEKRCWESGECILEGGIMEHNIVILPIELNQSHFSRRLALELILDLFPEVVQETCPAVI